MSEKTEADKIREIKDPAVREARASGYLADKSREEAASLAAAGKTQEAADARKRQANMINHLHEVADAENKNRS